MRRGTPTHPKVGKLAKELAIEPYAAVGLLELLFHCTAKYAIQGDIGKWTNEEIAEKCLWRGDVNAFVQALITCKWLDEDDTHRLLTHDWHEHRDDSVRKTLLAQKLQIFRPSRRKDSAKSAGSIPATKGKERKGKERKGSRKKAPPPSPPPDDLPDIAGIERPPRRKVVEVSEAAQIITSLVAQYNKSAADLKIFCPTGEKIERQIREKLVEAGVPLLDVLEFTVELVRVSVSIWRKHWAAVRKKEGPTAQVPWTVGHLCSAWVAEQEQQHAQAAKREVEAAAANTVAEELVQIKDAEAEWKEIEAFWKALGPVKQREWMDKDRALHGLTTEKTAKALAWQEQKG